MNRFLVIVSEPKSLATTRGHLLLALRTAGYQVHAAAPFDATTVRWLGENGIHYHHLPMARAAVAPFGDAILALRLYRIMRSLRPRVVLACAIKPIVYGIPAALAARVPRRHALITGLGYAFTDRHRSLHWKVVNAVARLLYAASLRVATTATFQNEDDRDDFRRQGLLGRTPANVVNGSGVDLDRFKVAPLPDEPRFLMIARLLRDKGLAEYLGAARQVRAARPEARFDLVGDRDPNPAGFPVSEVEAAVADGTVRYHGAVGDVRDAIANSRIYVLPSYREGTSRSVLEAMAMGRPVITTDAPGCRAPIVPGVNGLLVPVGATTPLAEAMIHLIDNPDQTQSMAQSSRSLAELRYDVQKVTAHMMEIIESGQQAAE
ncbi:glycosyltransferase family 4 protein [Mesorhizobium sp.]|nr:glycosyltransferase family 4 protein [Mesorhizobium sp.]TGQ13616.1 glycosyltransferase family 1 protein [Mesorhizobium sp. M00.F.Ca.ET.217.01.1.1]TGV85484.1 glycosyltransferase family 1 protein [Mesorhizobium sp. M00.F.Ca.ET.158.01.1.1]RWB68819.1 MAG: glycosyltransferase family 1 protein [Mesorhizobium sp.]RWF23773.1 MAG: glycosyltransferase family 1 protein [Mesorhizobium sp.]TIT10614.1 MAG: glycosyltransferase [Mesorhizobium sp.]